MDDILEVKADLRKASAQNLHNLSADEITTKTQKVTKRLFEFANFMEATIVMLYVNKENEVASNEIIRGCYTYNKIVVLPSFNVDKRSILPMKVDHPETDLITGPRGILEPDTKRCKIVSVDFVDIAIVPGLAFDEKGGRLGSGEGYYDRLIPKLAPTTRKVALAFEEQIFPQIPMISHDKHVDIIITDERVIYKI